MAPLRKTDRRTLHTAGTMREVVRDGIVVDEHTGAPPLWTNLPAQTKKDIEKELKILAKQIGVDFGGKGGLIRKAQRYTQTLHERGRKVIKGESEPDYTQIINARKHRKFVEVQFAEDPRKILKADSSSPPLIQTPSTVLPPTPVPAAPSLHRQSPVSCPVDDNDPDSPSPRPSDGDPLSPALFSAAQRRWLAVGQSPAPSTSPVPLAPGDLSRHCMSAFKKVVELLPEVTVGASESDHRFTLEMVMRFHKLGEAQNDVYEEQHLLTCTVTVKEDWSQVIDVQWPEFEGIMYPAGDQLRGTLDFQQFVTTCRLSFTNWWRRTCVLQRIAAAANMAVETPLVHQVGRLIDFKSIDGALTVRLDIPEEWPLWSVPIGIVSCTTVTGAECFSRQLLDDLARTALQPSGKGCLLLRILNALHEAYREKEEAKWSTPEGPDGQSFPSELLQCARELLARWAPDALDEARGLFLMVDGSLPDEAGVDAGSASESYRTQLERLVASTERKRGDLLTEVPGEESPESEDCLCRISS